MKFKEIKLTKKEKNMVAEIKKEIARRAAFSRLKNK